MANTAAYGRKGGLIGLGVIDDVEPVGRGFTGY